MDITITLNSDYTIVEFNHAIETAGRIHNLTGEIVEIVESDRGSNGLYSLSIGSYDSDGWHIDDECFRAVNERAYPDC